MSEATNLSISNDIVIKALALQQTSSLEIRKVLSIFLTNCTDTSVFTLNEDLVYQIFSGFLQTLADSIPDPDETWLKDVSFDKMCKYLLIYENTWNFNIIKKSINKFSIRTEQHLRL